MNNPKLITAVKSLMLWFVATITKLKLASKEDHNEDELTIHISDFSNKWNQLALKVADRTRICTLTAKHHGSKISSEASDQKLKEGDILFNISSFSNNWNKVALDYAARSRLSVKDSENKKH